MLTFYQTIKVVTGLLTAAPMISFGITNATNGNTAFGVGLIMFGAIAYFFPSWIMDRYTEKLAQMKQKITPF